MIGLVETHGRTQTAEQIGDLEVIPRRLVEHRGTTLEEMDVDAILARRPQVALVDELAHTNVPGSRNEKRWQDVEELLDAGIDVISTVNIQHLESLNDVVERITGMSQGETIPDEIVRRAEQHRARRHDPRRSVVAWPTATSIRRRASTPRSGELLPPGNLGALRELALLWVADRVDESLQEYFASPRHRGPWETRERVLVGVTGRTGEARR